MIATTTAPVTHTAARRAVVTAADEAARTLEVCVVPWGEVARVSDDGGRTFYDETWAPGSLEPADLVAVYDGHRSTPHGVERGEVIGRAAELTDDGTGYRAVIELADSARGRDVHAVARTLGTVWVSLEADVPPVPPGTATVARTAEAPCVLTGVSVVLPPARPAYTGAVGAARSDPDPDPDPTPETPEVPAVPEPTDTATRTEVLELVRSEVARMRPAGAGGNGAAPHPLARFGSFDEFHEAARTMGTDEAHGLSRVFADAYSAHRTAARVFVNQVTTDNPGVVPPAWLTEVFGIVDRGRPAITALGGPRSPGSSGLDVHWPTYTGDLTVIVTEQTAEKTDINSVKVSFTRAQATLKTYAGGSDVSYQLQRRSSPSYMALYDRILQIAYGLTTENAFVDALVAGAGATVPLTPIDATDSDIRGFLFGASAKVRTATGAPASVVLVSSDVFLNWGTVGDFLPATYGTSNVSGTAQASNLRINVSGLEIVEAPMAPAGTVLVTNPEAASWLEEGPFIATAEDVQKLGTDVAIWGMGAPGLFLPAGIVKAAAAAGATTTTATRGK